MSKCKNCGARYSFFQMDREIGTGLCAPCDAKRSQAAAEVARIAAENRQQQPPLQEVAAPSVNSRRSLLLTIGVACLCVSLAMLYFFTNVYDASARNGPVYVSGNKIWGAGFEDHQRRLLIWEIGKRLSVFGIFCGIVLSIIGGILRAAPNPQDKQ